MHVTLNPGPYFAGDLIGFSAGLLITILLLALTLRAAKLPGTPVANIIFAVCALLWSAGGLVQAGLLAMGIQRAAHVAVAIQFLGAAAFPIAILGIWRPFAAREWQKTAGRVLQIASYASAGLIASILLVGLVLHPRWISFFVVEQLAAYSDALLLVLGAAFLLRYKSTPRPVYFPSLLIVFAVTGCAIAMTVAGNMRRFSISGALFASLGAHLILLVVLCAFLLFARFRYADVFIRYGVRIVLAGTWATVLAFTTQSSLLSTVAHHSPSPWVVHVFGVMLVGFALLLSFTFVDERISNRVNRWLFRAPDYRAARRQLTARLNSLQDEVEIAAAAEEFAQKPLDLNGARLVAVDSLPPSKWPAGILEGEVVEIERGDFVRDLVPLPNVELLIPVASAGQVTHVLLVAPSAVRPSLVTHDIAYLQTIAIECGNRFDALHREREAIERQSRETLLLQQVTEAELRALRAQVNPHFLFNSLNTVADLIVRDPVGAEAMTLRLASVFRHVLAHSSRTLISIRDEMEFLRTYLHIEEARFGARLQVQIDMSPEVAGENVPSLILQPLVENALKHGLGPKPGPGHLWISAQADGNQICIRVEDDGMGPNGRPGRTESNGVGLANVADRLKTLYDDRASVVIEPRAGGGSRVTVLIPRNGQ